MAAVIKLECDWIHIGIRLMLALRLVLAVIVWHALVSPLKGMGSGACSIACESTAEST